MELDISGTGKLLKKTFNNAMDIEPIIFIRIWELLNPDVYTYLSAYSYNIFNLPGVFKCPQTTHQ